MQGPEEEEEIEEATQRNGARRESSQWTGGGVRQASRMGFFYADWRKRPRWDGSGDS